MNSSKELKIGVVLSYIQTAFNIVIALVYTPIMLSLLGKSEYGIYSIAASAISYVQLLDLGLARSYIKFFSEDRASGNKTSLGKTNGLFILCFIGIGCVALVLGLILTFNSYSIFAHGLSLDEHELVRQIMFILSISTAINLATSIYYSIVIAYEKFIVHRLIYLIRTVVQPALIWMLLLMGYKSVMMAYVSSIVSISVGFSYMFYCFYKLRIPVSLNDLPFVRLKNILVFSFFVVLNFIFDQLTWSMDKVILGRWVGAASVAVYTVGTQFSFLYMSFGITITSVFNPRLNRYVAENKPIKVISDLVIKIARMQTIVMLPVLLGFIVFGRQFIRLWAPNGYDDAYWVAVITMVAFSVDIIQNSGITIQMAQNKHKFRAILFTIMALLHIFVSVLVCEKYEAIGCAVAIALYFLLGPGLILNWYYQKHIGLDIIGFWKSLSSFVPTMIVCGVVGYVITRYITIQTWKMFVVCGIPFLLVYFIMVWVTAMNEDEKKLFIGVFHKI